MATTTRVQRSDVTTDCQCCRCCFPSVYKYNDVAPFQICVTIPPGLPRGGFGGQVPPGSYTLPASVEWWQGTVVGEGLGFIVEVRCSTLLPEVITPLPGESRRIKIVTGYSLRIERGQLAPPFYQFRYFYQSAAGKSLLWSGEAGNSCSPWSMTFTGITGNYSQGGVTYSYSDTSKVVTATQGPCSSGAGDVPPEPLASTARSFVMSSGADEAAPCRHRPDDPIPGHRLPSLNLSTLRTWYECGSPPAQGVPSGRPVKSCDCNPSCAGYRLSLADVPPLRWVSSTDLIRTATTSLLPKLPPDLSGVCGVARSGMAPAAEIAARLHLPLFAVDPFKGEPIPLPHGARAAKRKFPAAGGRLLVLDDTVYGGTAMRSLRGRLPDALLAAVFVRPEAAGAVDLYGEHLPSPHLLEWNLFNSGLLGGGSVDPLLRGGVAVDLDGVLCEDGPCPDEESDPAAYEAWLAGKRPLHLPRSWEVPLVVTGRLDRWRVQTEEWCRRWGVRAGRLEMWGGALAERETPSHHEQVGRFKGEVFARSNCGLFVESCPRQAEIVRDVAGKPVLCPTSGRVYQ